MYKIKRKQLTELVDDLGKIQERLKIVLENEEYSPEHLLNSLDNSISVLESLSLVLLNEIQKKRSRENE
jgi:hypothetical protein